MAGKCKACGESVGIFNLTNGICKLCLNKDENHEGINIKNYSSISDYSAAKGISKVISFIGCWVAVFIGVLATLIGLAEGAGMFAILVGAGFSISGLFLVVAGQITRATVDNASHTKEILEVIKKHYTNKDA